MSGPSTPGPGAARASEGVARPPSADVTAIVLAGGRSARFGADKLAAVVDGRPLLRRAVDAVASVSRDVVVVAAPGGTGAVSVLLQQGVGSAVRVVEDGQSFGGPLVGLLTGLREAHGRSAIVVAGDMPWLEPALLSLLIDGLGEGTASAATFAIGTGVERFPFAVRTDPAAPIAERLIDAGERRLRALLRELDPRPIPEERWRPLDPEGRTFRDVDRPGDLGDLGGAGSAGPAQGCDPDHS